MRYKTWRSRNDTHLHVLCVEGCEAFESLPVAIRNLGPWTGGPDCDVDRLRLPYCILLNEQKFVVIHAHVSELQLETVTRVHALHPANNDCPECKWQGRGTAAWWPEAEDLPPMQRPRLDQDTKSVGASSL